MASLYSIRAFAGSYTAGLSAVQYTVPAGNIFVARCMSVYADTGPGSAGSLIITGITTIAQVGGLAAGQWGQWEGRQVLNAGESLKVLAVGTVEISVSGYLLNA